MRILYKKDIYKDEFNEFMRVKYRDTKDLTEKLNKLLEEQKDPVPVMLADIKTTTELWLIFKYMHTNIIHDEKVAVVEISRALFKDLDKSFIEWLEKED